MKTYIEKDLKKTHLILESAEGEKEDYQIMMLRENDIPGILRVDVSYLDNQMYYRYDISGKESLEFMSKKANLKYEEMRTLVTELLETIYNLQKYMLEGNCLLLEPEHIFCERGHYYFCYYPPYKDEANVAFHRLTEFFVREVNYQDEEGVHFAYTLHKATMETHYSIERIMNDFAPEPKEVIEEKPEFIFVETIEEIEGEEPKNFVEQLKSFWKKIRSGFQSEEEKYL